MMIAAVVIIGVSLWIEFTGAAVDAAPGILRDIDLSAGVHWSSNAHPYQTTLRWPAPRSANNSHIRFSLKPVRRPLWSASKMVFVVYSLCLVLTFKRYASNWTIIG
jgi:hypothetical protein